LAEFKPKLFSVMKKYTLKQFYSDVIAGIIVAIIALPLSIALAIASGVSPEKGLHTAIIAGFIIAFLGGSRVQIGGPTGAFMVIVFGIVQKYGLDGLIISTIMAGIFMILMGVCRLGQYIKFIPYPITTGFTSGIALTIFATQLKDFFGFKIDNVPADFIGKVVAYAQNFSTFSIQSILIGAVSLLIIILWPKINRKIPGSLVAIIVATIIVLVFKLDVETIGSKFGEISSALPRPSIPNLSLERIQGLIQPAFTIALLGSIESLLSAVVADGIIGSKHKSNMELIAQGVANIFSGLFGGMPATGAIARTAANIKNGGRTPIAGMVHSVVLLLIMVLFMPYAKMIPLTTLAAVLIIVAYNMCEWRSFVALFKAPKSDIFVLLTTFGLTVAVDLVVAIEVGMVLASILFMKRMADVTNISDITSDMSEDTDEVETPEGELLTMGDDVLVYEVNGPMFFGAADKFVQIVEEVQDAAKVLILSMKNVHAMDATAYRTLVSLYKTCERNGTQLILSGIQQQPYLMLKKAGFLDKIGQEGLCEDFTETMTFEPLSSETYRF